MKKLLLTLIVSIAICGTIFAQYESHWPDFYYKWENNSGLTAAFAINGHIITCDDEGWDALEAGFFITDSEGNEEQRGVSFLDPEGVLYFDAEYPSTNGAGVGYTSPGDTTYFKLWDHANQVLYTQCEATYLGEHIDIVTGNEYLYEWFLDPYVPIILWFTSEEPATGIEKTINGYGAAYDPDNNNNSNYYLIASPVGNVLAESVTNMTTGTFDLFYFDEAGDDNDKEWINYEKSDNGFTTLEAGKGYMYANIDTVTLAFPGEANTDIVTVTLANTAGKYFAGMNLIGNPYNVDAYITKPYYRMNPQGNGLLDETDGAIAPMEGVFVYTANDGEELTFSMENPGKKTSKLDLNLINGQGVIDRATVNFDGATLPKFQINSSSTKLYIPMDDKDYAMVSSEAMGDIPVSFKASKNGSYTINVNSQEVSFGYLHLIDNKTGMDVDLLATPSYSFDALTTDYANRFRLVFATGNGGEDNFAFYSNGNLIINNEGEAVLQVVDVTGRILSNEIISGCASVNVERAAGVYMIRLINGDNVKVQKVVVR